MINKHETPIKIIELTDMTVLKDLIRQIKEAHWLLSTNWFTHSLTCSILLLL